MAELWDIYDKSGKRTGEVIKRGEPLPKQHYHLVAHIWVRNSKGEFLIQKRQENLSWRPGLWAVTGGSAVTGEDAFTAAKRELAEELGLTCEDRELEFMLSLKRRDSLCTVWMVRSDCAIEDLTLQKEEVADAKWVSVEELRGMMADRSFYTYDYFELFLRAVCA